MPFKSAAQRRFMYSQHPDIANRWRKESGPQKGLPDKVNPNQAKGFRQELADPVKGKDAFKKYRGKKSKHQAAAKRRMKKYG